MINRRKFLAAPAILAAGQAHSAGLRTLTISEPIHGMDSLPFYIAIRPAMWKCRFSRSYVSTATSKIRACTFLETLAKKLRVSFLLRVFMAQHFLLSAAQAGDKYRNGFSCGFPGRAEGST